MIDATFTPGPWCAEYAAGDDTHDDIAIVAASRDVVLEMTVPRKGPGWANAELIASAPVLYEVLGRYVRQDELAGVTNNGLYRDARAALHKASPSTKEQA